MEPKVTSPVLKGFLIGVTVVAIALIMQFTSSAETLQRYQGLLFVIMMAGVAGSCMLYAKQMQGSVGFGTLFAHGFKVTAVYTLIMILFTILSVKFLTPEMVQKGVEAARLEMHKNPANELTEEQMEQNLGKLKENFLTLALMGVVFINVFLGAVASLLGAAVAKKNPTY